MKPVHLIPPAVALILAGGWISIQRQALGSVEREHAVLQARIAAAESAHADVDASLARSGEDEKPVDWRLLGHQFSEIRHSGGTGDARPFERFQLRVETMTAGELIDALAEIDSWNDPGSAATLLKTMVMRALLKKDPELAFTRFAQHLRTDREIIGYQFSDAFRQWVEKDPEKATAWFDGRIAAGDFDSKSLDGRSQSRSGFEAGLLAVLFSSDVEAAFKRLGAIADPQRGEALENCEMAALKAESQLTFMKLARAGLSEDQVAGIMVRQSQLLVSAKDFSNVSAFLDRASATAAERTGCAGEAATANIQMISNERKITRDDLDVLRQWVSTQSPDSTDRITGEVLAKAADGTHPLEFAEAAGIALRYGEGSGSDDALVSFLKSDAAATHKDQALVLAGKIRDGKLRAEIIENLK